jgi:hypothetical protein
MAVDRRNEILIASKRCFSPSRIINVVSEGTTNGKLDINILNDKKKV